MTPDEMKALIDSVAHDIVEHRWPHVDAEVFEELRQAHLDLAEKIVTEVLAALSAHPAEETDSARRLLWIIADRNIDGITISDAELVAVPRLPGISVERDLERGVTVIRAVPTDREADA
ncbi:MAG TPA: hypothetical protein VNR37_03415 [Microbacteriaceae bacterium]|nr:hypothetical protein [Microbacteriaceae bacterium]